MVRYHWKITGLVQGVFYRKSFQERALCLGVVGTVMNCADGSVEAVVEAEKDVLEELNRWAQSGPPMASVEDVHVIKSEEINQASFTTFSIIR